MANGTPKKPKKQKGIIERREQWKDELGIGKRGLCRTELKKPEELTQEESMPIS